MTRCCRTLNRIQSRIYRTAFYSNENILVCAPTGAGKTNIAMIAILREVAANMQQGQIQRHAFKIVYVAPMKALAAEQTATFSRRLADLGVHAPPFALFLSVRKVLVHSQHAAGPDPAKCPRDKVCTHVPMKELAAGQTATFSRRPLICMRSRMLSPAQSIGS